jgi:XTP/dITP diphosphohydrolase
VPLTLLITSPRVAPGLLSWSAWQAIGAADRRLTSVETPLSRAVAAAGHAVDVHPANTGPALLALAEEADAVWLATDAEAERLPSELAAAIVEGDGPEVEVLHGSYDVPGARLLDLVTVMDRLRTHCPWDREQTHRSLGRYLLEETYETLEAIDTGDVEHLREELGDLLLQVVFHARVAAEAIEQGFTIDDVAGGIVEKLVHRHPHVFAGLEVADAGEVEANWESLKAAEKGRASVLDGVPMALPALALADKVLGKAAKVGLTPNPDSSAVPPPGDPAIPQTNRGSEEIGDRLLALVVEARAAGVDPEQALRDAVRRVVEAVRAAELG